MGEALQFWPLLIDRMVYEELEEFEAGLANELLFDDPIIDEIDVLLCVLRAVGAGPG
jgi:hypothetical protein